MIAVLGSSTPLDSTWTRSSLNSRLAQPRHGVTGMMDDWAKSQNIGTPQRPTLADALALALARGLDLALALALALDLALDRHRPRPVAHARARARARALDLAVDLDIAVTHALDRARARALAPDLDLAHALDLALSRARALAHVFDLDCDHDKFGLIARDLRRQILDEDDSVLRRRKQLLVCLLDIVGAGDDRFVARKAWRDYAICLLGLGLPNLSKRHRDELAPIQFVLCLLRAREAGEVQAYEGILLVRDRKPS